MQRAGGATVLTVLSKHGFSAGGPPGSLRSVAQDPGEASGGPCAFGWSPKGRPQTALSPSFGRASEVAVRLPGRILRPGGDGLGQF